MKIKIFISMVFIFFMIFISAYWAEGATDKTPSINTMAHGGYYCSWDSDYFHFWDEHIDFQTSSGAPHYANATRNQWLGQYENCWHDYIDGGYYNDLRAYFNSIGVHRDSAFAHYKKNTYQIKSIGLFVPGWNPSVNDLNNDWIRDWDADYDHSANFTVQRTSSPYYIEDAGGGRSGVSWTANKWQNAYVKLGWGGNADTVSYIADSSSSSRIYLPSQPPAQSYTWFIVDDPSATDHDAVAMADSTAHIYLYNMTPGYQRVAFNILDPRVRAWGGKNQATAARKVDYGYVSLFEDNIFPHYPWWASGIVMGGTTLENFEDNWITGFRDFWSEVKDSCGSGFVILGNTGDYFQQFMDTLIGNLGGSGSGLDGFWYEFGLRASAYNWAWGYRYDAIERRKSVAKYQMLHAKWEPILGDYDRSIMVVLCQYYLIKDMADSIYFLQDTDPNYGVKLCDSTYWWRGIMGVDMGSPTQPAAQVLESGVYIWKRSFENGLVVYKPKPEQGSNYTDATLHTLPTYYYRLNINGDIAGDSINQVSLRNGEGVILLSTGGGTQSQIYPPQPFYPPNGATVDTAQPTLVIRNTQDPESRPLIYYFEIDNSVQFNSGNKKESTPFELETSEDSTTKWTVPTPLSSGVWYWRSLAYTNTYPSDTSQFSLAYHFQLSTGVGDSLYDLYLYSPVGDEMVVSLRPSLNAQFVHNHFDRNIIKVKFELSENTSFSSGKTILSPLIDIPEDLTISWTLNQDLRQGLKYFWRVNVYDSEVLVGSSDFASFQTGSIHLFPNPFKPTAGDSFITFRNIPLYSKITITTLSGELVQELSSNTSTDVVWDVKNRQGKDLASGVYYYRVDFSTGSTSGKLAIIR